MNTLWPLLRAWFARRKKPAALALAEQKRIFERGLRARGLSNSEAKQRTREHFE